MRLDHTTESQIDDIIIAGTNRLVRLCSYTMGCDSRKDIVFNKGDRIQLFKDSRIKSVELTKMELGKIKSIAVYEINSKESYIIVPQQINRENIDSYSLHFIK